MDKDSIKKQMDDAKTAAEHEAIISNYLSTGYLNRDEAIKKYKDFNNDHPEYYFPMRVTTISAGTTALIDDVPDNIIVGNLNQQLIYLTGKNLLEDMKNG